jgi:hypothetical protein
MAGNKSELAFAVEEILQRQSDAESGTYRCLPDIALPGGPLDAANIESPAPPDPPPVIRAHLRSTVPPGDYLSLDVPLVLPEQAFFSRLDDLARRTEMLGALLQVGGLSRPQGARAIQSTLKSIAVSAEEAQVHGLGQTVQALQRAVGELIEGTSIESPSQSLDVLILDPSELSRDFAALAVAVQGHLVRCAKSYDEFVQLMAERLPDLVIAEVVHGKTPPDAFCNVLAEALDARGVRLVIFSASPPAELERLRRKSRAIATISKDLGLPALVAEISQWVTSRSVTLGPPRQ